MTSEVIDEANSLSGYRTLVRGIAIGLNGINENRASPFPNRFRVTPAIEKLSHGLGCLGSEVVLLQLGICRARPLSVPRLVDDEHLERCGIRGPFDLRRRPLQDVKQQRLQHIGIVRPAIEVEGLEARECERVLGIVEEMAELPGLCPAIQALPERAEDGCEVGESPYIGGQHVCALDRGEQGFFIFGRQLVAPADLDQNPEKQVQKVHVLVGRRKRKWIDRKAGIFEADV